MIADFYSSYASFIEAVYLGLFFGALYDVFRILRVSRLPNIVPKGKFYDTIKIPQKSIPKRKTILNNIIHLSGNAIVVIEDIIFWIIATVAQILFIYHTNGGEIRIYFFAFSFAGAALYFFTFGKLVMYFAVRIIFLIRCLLYWLFYIIIYPIRKTLSALRKFAVFLASKTIKPIVAKIKTKAMASYSKKRVAFIISQSQNGFLTYRSKNNDKKTKKHIA